MDNKGFYISFKVDGGVYVSAKNEETARKFFEREFSVSNSVLLGFDSKLSYPEINAAVIDSICSRFDELAKPGTRQSEVAKMLEQESGGGITAKQILNHYRYHKGLDDPNKKKSYNKKNADVVSNVRRSIERQKLEQAQATWEFLLAWLTELGTVIKGMPEPRPDIIEKLRDTYRTMGVSLGIQESSTGAGRCMIGPPDSATAFEENNPPENVSEVLEVREKNPSHQEMKEGSFSAKKT